MISLSPTNFLIYALKCPISLEIRYIGKSTVGLKRPKQHFAASHYNKGRKVSNWVKSVIKKGYKPIIEVLDYAKNNDELNLKEQFYINKYKNNNLCNLTLGGEGAVGYKHTKKSLEKMSKFQRSKKISPEGRKNMSNAMSGIKNPFYGKTHNNKTRLNLHKKHKGKRYSPRTEFKKGQKAPNAVKIKDNFGHIFNSIKEAAEFYDFDRTSIFKYLYKDKQNKYGIIFQIL